MNRLKLNVSRNGSLMYKKKHIDKIGECVKKHYKYVGKLDLIKKYENESRSRNLRFLKNIKIMDEILVLKTLFDAKICRHTKKISLCQEDFNVPYYNLSKYNYNKFRHCKELLELTIKSGYAFSTQKYTINTNFLSTLRKIQSIGIIGYHTLNNEKLNRNLGRLRNLRYVDVCSTNIKKLDPKWGLKGIKFRENYAVSNEMLVFNEKIEELEVSKIWDEYSVNMTAKWTKNICKSKELKYLNINSTNLNNDSIYDLQMLSNLCYLNVNNTNLRDGFLSKINWLTNLEKLDIGSNHFRHIHYLKDLRKLVSLNLSYSNCRKYCNEIGLLTNLRELLINNAQIDSINFIKSMKKLRYLNCNDNDIRNIDILKDNNEMEKLNISKNLINDSSIKVLSSISNLKKVNVNKTFMTFGGICSLLVLRKNLKIKFNQLCTSYDPIDIGVLFM